MIRVARSSVLSILWSFSIYHQLTFNFHGLRIFELYCLVYWLVVHIRLKIILIKYFYYWGKSMRTELSMNFLTLQEFRGHLFLLICSSFVGTREVIIMLWEVSYSHCGAVIEIRERPQEKQFLFLQFMKWNSCFDIYDQRTLLDIL